MTRKRTLLTILGSALASLVVVTGGIAYANHQFSDVATGFVFHDDIGEIADAGCASGFNDGTFRSGDNTKRGQFAFWLSNCGGRVAYDFGPNGDLDGPEEITQAEVTIESPTETGVGGYVSIQANVYAARDMSATNAFSFEVRIEENGTERRDTSIVLDPDNASFGVSIHNASLAYVDDLPAGGQRTYSVVFENTGPTDDTYVEADITVTYHPFDFDLVAESAPDDGAGDPAAR